ncbi:hypothetical protein FA15DRAFT_581941 [Coprinopsis marcescibilis]|uniref:CCZ1/INTU/HSP4 first Longin domain-containing protein n=1 Tax=Coprinopsis marcescibilis TaxID=230819 RepID=A0A5C3LA77_COPMA|nr:hypothetical protein FA15DRAFT_581941 [Coprinopsis marcescibilis]
MLRQIGLAKALVNFSELFDPHNAVENVHSQTRRMVMVSPEPNFWINVSIELPKIAQSSTTTSKSNAAGSKAKSKGKEKEASSATKPAPVTYDYEDGAIHDTVIQAQLLQGYERFKLLHGSFSSILNDLGQEALELQLERFFTVWAWTWNLEDKAELSEHLGTRLHPYFSILMPLLDGYSSLLPDPVIPVLFLRPYIIPSSRYTAAKFPETLAQHLLTMIPAPHGEDNMSASIDTIRALSPTGDPSGPNIFGIPGVNMEVMDVRKWNWTSYLTFGKGSSSSSHKSTPSFSEKQSQEGQNPSAEVQPESQPEPGSESTSNVETQVDPKALEDALSENVPTTNSIGDASADPAETVTTQDNPFDAADPDQCQELLRVAVSSSPNSSLTMSPTARNMSYRPESPPTPPEPPEFSLLNVRLAPASDPISTSRRTVHFYTRNGLLLALLGVDEMGEKEGILGTTEDDVLALAAEHADELFDTVELNIEKVSESKLAESLPSATKLLQASDRFIISTGQYTVSTPEFASQSSHLHNAKSLLRKDPDVLEVFSRGQNPQYWHVARRGLAGHDAVDHDDSTPSRDGEMYLEVFRKEATLPDVDNVLAGSLRKSGVAENGLI